MINLIEKVKIIRKDKSLPLPKYHTDGSVGFDLYCSESVTIMPKEIKLVDLNAIIEVPKDHVLMLTVRSSTPRKKGLVLANSVGIIDYDYCGPEDKIGALFYNFTDNPVNVEKGDRLVQGIFIEVIKPIFEEVEKIDRETRGGFGATGK